MDSRWPVRSLVCLDCRTLHAAACPHGHAPARSVAPAAVAGRERLLTQVWGPPKQRKHAAYPGWYRGPMQPPKETELRDGDDILMLFLEPVLRWVGRKVGIGRPPRMLLPSGGGPLPAVVRHDVRRGVVRATRGEPKDPFTAEPCVAYDAVLTYGEARAVVLREAATCGFDLELEDGGLIEVPPGECLPWALAPVRYSIEATTRVREIDPLGKDVEALPPFPHDQVQVQVLRAGARVEISGPFVPLSRLAEGEVGFRAAPTRVLAPQGTVRLHA